MDNLHRDVVVFVVGIGHPNENACIDHCDRHQLFPEKAGSSS